MTPPMTSVADHIEHASEAVRAASHATACGLLDGPASYTAVGNLAELVERLPQVLDFLALSLRRIHAEDHYDDRGLDPADTLSVACGAVLTARAGLVPVRHELAVAHNRLGHIGRRLPED